MKIIEGITDSALQENTVTLDDGTNFTFVLKFVPMQYGWFFESLIYEDFVLNGFRVCNSPNILHQFRNELPFGIACISENDREPSLQNDFVSGQSKFYLLDEEEKQAFARFLSGQV